MQRDTNRRRQWLVLFGISPLGLILALLLMMRADGNYLNQPFQWLGQLLLLLLWVLLQFRQWPVAGRRRLPVSLLVLWLWMGLSVCWAGGKTAAVLEWMAFSTLLPALAIGSRLIEVERIRLQEVACLVLLGLALQTLYQGLWLGMPRPGGFFANNSNSQGILLVSLLLGVIAVNLVRSQHSLALGGLIVMAVMAVCLQGGRGPLLVLLSLTMVVMVLARRVLHCSRQHLFWTAGCLGLGLVMGYGLNSEFLLRLAGLAHEWHDDPGALGTGRAGLWMAAWHLYQDHALLGVGFNNYHLYYFQYADPQQVNVSAGNFVHNDYLQMLVELGPIGLLLILVWLGDFALISRRLLLSESTQVRCALPCLAGAWAILLHAGIDHNLTNEPLLLVLGLMMGAGYQCFAQLNPQPQPARSGWVRPLLAAVYGLVLAYLVVAYQKVYDFERQPAQAPLLRVAAFQQLLAVMPFNDIYRAKLAGFLLGLIRTEPGAVNLEEEAMLLAYADQQIDQVLQLNSQHWLFLQIKATISEMSGQTELAGQYFQQVVRKNPVQLEPKLKYARLLLTQHQSERARAVLLQALGRLQIVSVPQLVAYCDLIDQHWSALAGWRELALDLRATAAFYTQDASVRDKTFYLHMPDISARPG